MAVPEGEAQGEGGPATAEAAQPPQSSEPALEYEKLRVTSIDPVDVARDDGPPELSEATGVPKVLRAYVVHAEPRISVVPHFLSDAEIEHLLELSEDEWVPSVVGTGVYKTNDEAKDLTNKPSNNRTSYSCMLRSAHSPMVESIEHRLARLADMDVHYLERLNMVRYSPGQLFNKHHDGRFRPKTVFIYLNDLPEGAGGETLFPELGVQFVPRKGCAVMWSNILSPGVEDRRTYHQGLPPRAGVKYGVNCFFNDKPLKQWEDAESAAAGEAVARRSVDPDELLREEGSQALRPGQIHAFTVSQEPRVAVVPGLLGAEEAAALRALAGPPEERVQPSQEQLDSVFPAIERRLAAIAGLPLAHMDPLRVAKCDRNMIPDGQGIAKGDYTKRFGQKVVFVFLNDVPEGGELAFPRLGLEVRPREGCGVVWPVCGEDGQEDLRAAHQGRPPKSGSRYCAFGVFRDAPVRGVPAKA